tara:strand:+ start:323 stop:457 length:135 start_codon:yes stop_codon:yes gene_type:complete
MAHFKKRDRLAELKRKWEKRAADGETVYRDKRVLSGSAFNGKRK